VSEEIIQTIADYYDIYPKQIKGKCRKREFVKARFLAMFLIRQETGFTLDYIGEMFSNRDHSSVIHAIKSINDALTSKFDNDVRRDYLRLKELV
jgi:chromosomal replication initiator protein